MAGIETQLYLCSHKLTTTSHHLALGEKKTMVKSTSQVAKASRQAGAKCFFSSAPFLVSIAEFSDSEKTTFDYIKVLGAGEHWSFCYQQSKAFRKKRPGGGDHPWKVGRALC